MAGGRVVVSDLIAHLGGIKQKTDCEATDEHTLAVSFLRGANVLATF